MKKIILISAFLVLLTTTPIVKAQLSDVTNPLNLENVSIVPSKIYVGSNFTLSGTVRDLSTQYLYFVRLTIQGGFPFSKTSPLTSFYIGSLTFNQTYQFSIPLSIDNDAINQQYSLQMKADYTFYDPVIIEGLPITNSEMLTATIKVDKGADIEIVNESFPQPIVPDMKDGIVILYLQNMGINSAKQVELNLAAEYPFTPTGKTFFIDEIKPNQTVAATFHVDVDSSAATQTFPLDMTINWKEGDNQYSNTKTFGIPVQPSSLSLPFLGALQTNGIIVVAGVIVAVAAFILWKRKGKPKKSAKN